MAALGGSNAALPFADVSLFLTNPAYLNKSSHGQISVSYLNHLADLNMGFSSFAWDFDEIGTFGIGFRYLGYGDIPHTNASGENLGTFSANDFSVSVGMGRTFMDQIDVGVSLQFVHSSYYDFRSSAITFSAGAFYTFDDEQTWAGFAINNAGTQLTYFDDQRESLPVDTRISITRQLQYLPLRLTTTAHSLTTWKLPSFNDEQDPGFADHLFRHLILGAEFIFTDNFHLRLGYNHYLHEETQSDNRIDLGGVSYGAGITIQGFEFHISRNSYSDIGSLTQLGIQYQL